MDLTPYVDNLRRELAVAAEAGGDDARALAERLTAPLESAIRLTLLDALSAAADEITRELAPGSVRAAPARARARVRRDAAAGRAAVRRARPARGGRPAAGDAASGDEGATARINLRLPEQLKGRIEEAAAQDGSRSTPGSSAPPPPRWSPATATAAPRGGAPIGGQRYTGWVR